MNSVLDRGLAHQTDGQLVILAKNVQLLVVQATNVLIFVVPLSLIVVSGYLQRQVDGRPLGDGAGAADRTFSTTFQFPEFVQTGSANVVATWQENRKAINVRAPGTK